MIEFNYFYKVNVADQVVQNYFRMCIVFRCIKVAHCKK